MSTTATRINAKDVAALTPRLTPKDDRVIVAPDVAGEKTPGGILLPESAKEKLHTGTVVACGPGMPSPHGGRIELTTAVGERVLYGQYAGNDFTFLGVKLMAMREADTLTGIDEPEETLPREAAPVVLAKKRGRK